MKVLSVVIPTYKGEDSLPVALESLVKQSYKNLEVIVSDDNGEGSDSQLKTQKIIEKFKSQLNLIYLVNDHVNGSHARNEGLKAATGDYISLLDDDDFYLNDYADEAVKAFEDPTIDMVFFNVAVLTKEGVSRTVKNESINGIDLLFYRKEIGTGSNLCFRKKVFTEDGGFDERYLRSQDIEFAVKKLHKYSSAWVDKLEIVKYFNKTDNFPNYEKSLDTYSLLRDDLHDRQIINDEIKKQLQNSQLHSLYNDMLAKNADVQDVRSVYQKLEKLGSLSVKDKGMMFVYSLSKRLFAIVFKMYLSLNNNWTNAKELLEYRESLVNEAK